jgi:CBS domain-containing protein
VLRLSDIMTADIATVSPETSLQEAVELFAAKHVSGAPVVAGGTILGVVTAADILSFSASNFRISAERRGQTEWGDWSEATEEERPERENVAPGSYFTDLWAGDGEDVAEQMEAAESPERNVLDEHTVDEVMTRTVWSLPPNHSVLEAADLMRRKAIHRVLVVDDGRLVGLVSALDITGAVADHKVTERRYVFNRDRDFGEPRFP